MEFIIAVLALAIIIKANKRGALSSNRKPVPAAKPVRKWARFGAEADLHFPTPQSWNSYHYEIHDLNDREDFEMALS